LAQSTITGLHLAANTADLEQRPAVRRMQPAQGGSPVPGSDRLLTANRTHQDKPPWGRRQDCTGSVGVPAPHDSKLAGARRTPRSACEQPGRRAVRRPPAPRSCAAVRTHAPGPRAAASIHAHTQAAEAACGARARSAAKRVLAAVGDVQEAVLVLVILVHVGHEGGCGTAARVRRRGTADTRCARPLRQHATTSTWCARPLRGRQRRVLQPCNGNTQPAQHQPATASSLPKRCCRCARCARLGSFCLVAARAQQSARRRGAAHPWAAGRS